VDERGLAVHEECYVAKVASTPRDRKVSKTCADEAGTTVSRTNGLVAVVVLTGSGRAKLKSFPL
jgi:hypothetical protein